MDTNLLDIISADIDAIVVCDLPWEKLSGCQILITGAAGFIGNYLTRVLLSLYRLGKVAQPISVLAMVRDLDRACTRFADLLQNPDFKLLHWDLNNIAVPDIGSAQYILHAASQASPRFYGSDPVGTLLPNAVGTAALLEALRHSNDPRGLLFVSSSEVYGVLSGDVSLSETHYGIVDPSAVRSCYAESKRIGETMCVAWHHQYGIPIFIVRPFHTYGPGLMPDDGRVFADFAFNVVRNQNIIMNSDGSARRAFCYVTDAITGFFSVLLKGEPGVPFNVANPAGELSVAELASLLVEIFPEKKLSVEQRCLTDGEKYIPSTYTRLIPNVARLHALGWQAKVTPSEGFKRMIRGYL